MNGRSENFGVRDLEKIFACPSLKRHFLAICELMHTERLLISFSPGVTYAKFLVVFQNAKEKKEREEMIDGKVAYIRNVIS